LKTFSTIRSTDYELNRISENARDVLNPLAQNPFLNGQLLENISLTAGVDNYVEHKLDRPVRFWMLVRGPIVTDNLFEMTDFQPATLAATVGSTSGTLAVGTGGGALYQAKYKKIGDEAHVLYQIRIGTVGATDVVGTYKFPFPTGLSPIASLNVYDVIGYGDITSTGTASPLARLVAKWFTGNYFIVDNSDTTTLANAGALFNNTNTVSIMIRYQVSGWTGNNASNFSLWENTSEFPNKYLKLRTNVTSTVSLYVG
jgi:hypothetical protein